MYASYMCVYTGMHVCMICVCINYVLKFMYALMFSMWTLGRIAIDLCPGPVMSKVHFFPKCLGETIDVCRPQFVHNTRLRKFSLLFGYIRSLPLMIPLGKLDQPVFHYSLNLGACCIVDVCY